MRDETEIITDTSLPSSSSSVSSSSNSRTSGSSSSTETDATSVVEYLYPKSAGIQDSLKDEENIENLSSDEENIEDDIHEVKVVRIKAKSPINQISFRIDANEIKERKRIQEINKLILRKSKLF